MTRWMLGIVAMSSETDAGRVAGLSIVLVRSSELSLSTHIEEIGRVEEGDVSPLWWLSIVRLPMREGER